MKRIISLLLAFMLVLSLIVGPSTNSVQAAGTLSITCSAGAIVKGESKTFKVVDAKGKKVTGVKWKVSSTKYASISSKGKLKAIKPGTVTITAKKGSKKATLKVTIFKASAKMIVNRKIKGKKGLYLISKGKVVKKSGFATDGINWYYTKGGVVSSKTTGFIKGKVNKKSALWYVNKGKVMLGFTGPVKSGNDTFFVKSGILNKSLKGNISANGYTYKVKDGKVLKTGKGTFDYFIGDSFKVKAPASAEDAKPVKIEGGISFTLYEYYPITNFAEFSMTVNGKEIKGQNMTISFENTEQPKAYLEEFYPVYPEVLSCQDGVITYRFKNVTNIMKPMQISGLAKDSYTTKDYTYIESNNFIIYLPPNVTFPGNILKMYERLKVEVEKEIPLSKKTTTFKATYKDILHQTRECYPNTDAYLGVEPGNKIPIYVRGDEFKVAATTLSSCGLYSNINIHKACLEVNNGDAQIFAHEYAHYVHLLNCPGDSVFVTEGYADYIADKVMKNNPDISYDGYYFNLKLLDELKKTDKIEDLLDRMNNKEFQGKEFNYYLGYMFFTYIEEQYGKAGVTKFLNETIKNGVYNPYVKDWFEDTDLATTKKTVKSTFGNSFFIDFKKWIDKKYLSEY